MSGTLCELFDCPDWQAELQAALAALMIGVSTIVDNGDGTFTHTNGNGVVTVIDSCDLITDGVCEIFTIQGTDVGGSSEIIPVGSTIIFRINPDATETQTVVNQIGGTVFEVLIPQPQNNSEYVLNVDGSITLSNGTGGVAEPDLLTIPIATDTVNGLITDKQRAWGTGDAQRRNSDDVTVNDTIYHLGDTVVGAVDSNVNAGAKLTVVDNVAVTNTFDHTFGGNRSLLAGQTNTTTGNRVVGWGRDNSFANNSGGGGNGNITTGTNAFTVGEDNVNAGNAGLVGGVRNTLTDNNGLVVGADNTVNDESGITFGENNTSTGGSQIVGGNNVVSGGERGVSIGTNLTVTAASASSAIFGKEGAINHNGVLMWSGDLLGVADFVSVQDGEVASRSTGTRLYTNRDGAGSITQGVLIGSVQNFAGTFLETSAGGAFTAAGAGTGAGAHLTNGGVWTNASSKMLKENFKKVNVLHKVKQLDISRWNYKTTPDRTHIGVMADQFNELFRTGTKGTIDTISPSGVSLRAVQELSQEVDELKVLLKSALNKIQQLEAKV